MKKRQGYSMKIDLSLKEIKYLKDVMLFQRLIDPKAKEIALDIVLKLSTILDTAEEIRKEDKEDKKYRRKIVK